jgi:vitamin B12 transporter
MRTTYLPRETGEEASVRFSVRVLFFIGFAAFFTIIFTPPGLLAQSQTAKLSGVVTDPHGAAIVGARVSAEPVSTESTAAHGISANDGQFSLTLAPGKYRLTIARDSFATAQQEINLVVGESREIDIRLTLEPLSSKVVVTAQALPLDAESSPAPVTILTHEQIEQRVATSLPDLLAMQPGFSLGRTSAEGGTASLFLDGGNSNYTKVLVDGVPANQPGGLIDFSNFTLDNIDKIEIVHGAESALYGSDAMDGVIQIFTHRGTTRIPEFTAFADGGNFDTGHGGAELSGLLGRFDYSAGVSDLETSGQGPNDAFRNRTLSGNFGWRISDTARISLSLRDTDSQAGTPGQTLLQPANLTDTISYQNFYSGLHAEFATGSHWQHQVSGTELYSREFNFDPSFPSFYQYNRAAFTGQSTYLIRAFAFTAGYEYEVENGFLSDVGIHERRNNQAGFFDARWQPIARLTLNAGARAEDNANFGTKVVPRVGASYALRIAQGALGDTRLRASYGLGIVEPRFDQSFGTDPCYPGNPNLLPEQSWTLHAGFEQKLASDRVRVTMDYFDSSFRDIVSFAGLSAPPPGCSQTEFTAEGAGTYFNTDLARSRGASLSTEARISRWLTASGNYTYDPTRVLAAPNAFDPSEIPGNRLLRRPVNSGNLMLNAAFKRMNWNVSGYFTGRRTDSDFLGDGITSNAGYALLNLGGSYNLSHGVSFYGRIANLANKQYQEALGYPALGREFRIGVKYTTRHE